MSYVDWLRRNVELFADLADQMEHCWGGTFRRKQHDWDPPEHRQPTNGKVDLRSLRRKYSVRFHPDKCNGSGDAMTAINCLIDELERLL